MNKNIYIKNDGDVKISNGMNKKLFIFLILFFLFGIYQSVNADSGAIVWDTTYTDPIVSNITAQIHVYERDGLSVSIDNPVNVFKNDKFTVVGSAQLIGCSNANPPGTQLVPQSTKMDIIGTRNTLSGVGWIYTGDKPVNKSGSIETYTLTFPPIATSPNYYSTSTIGSHTIDLKFKKTSLTGTVTYQFGRISFTVAGVSLKANNSVGPITVDYGATTSLSWVSAGISTSASYPTGCKAVSGSGWSGNQATTSVGLTTGPLYTSSTHKIECYVNSSLGTTTSSVIINVLPAPTVLIKANNTPGSISVGSNSTVNLSWVSTNTSGNCTASGGDIGWSGTSQITSGNYTTPSLTSTKVYTITCQNAAGSATSSSVNVNIIPPINPIITNFSAQPSTIQKNGVSMLNWESSNTNYCEASMDDSSIDTDIKWNSSRLISSDSTSTDRLNTIGKYIYKIKCFRNSDYVYATTSVNVISSLSVDLSASNYNPNPNESVTLTYWSSGAERCYMQNDEPMSINSTSSRGTGLLLERDDPYPYIFYCYNSLGDRKEKTIYITVSDDTILSPVCTVPSSVIANTLMKWNVSGIPSGSSVSYKFDNGNYISSSYPITNGITEIPKIYTTVGQKTFNVTVTSGSKTGTCSASTTAIQVGGGGVEF